MNTQSNSYTFIFAAVMVLIVAAILSFTAFNLQPLQEQNVKVEKYQNILASVKIESTPANAEELFNQYITGDMVLDANGNVLEGKGFDVKLKPEVDLMYEAKRLVSELGKVSADQKASIEDQLATIKTERRLPLFTCSKEDGDFIIIPVQGKGLWGPIWGFVSLEMDYNTIYGAIFAHKGETPGLGAEIDQTWFQEPFQGKKIFKADGTFVGVNVYKGGFEAVGDFDHGIDGISGGTITSVGLEAMIKDCLVDYAPYFKAQMAKESAEPEEVSEPEVSEAVTNSQEI